MTNLIHAFVKSPDLDLPPGLVDALGLSIGELMEWFANAVLRQQWCSAKPKAFNWSMFYFYARDAHRLEIKTNAVLLRQPWCSAKTKSVLRNDLGCHYPKKLFTNLSTNTNRCMYAEQWNNIQSSFQLIKVATFAHFWHQCIAISSQIFKHDIGNLDSTIIKEIVFCC